MPDERWTTARLNDMLLARYAAPEWKVLFEVRNFTGIAGRERYADALCFNMFPSRGQELHGIEVKLSRSDWVRELKQPEKSAAIQKYCDRWFVLAAPGVVDQGELPGSWGLIEPNGARLHTLVAAPKLEAEPFSRGFFLSLLRKLIESHVAKAEVQPMINKANKEGEAHGKWVAERTLDPEHARRDSRIVAALFGDNSRIDEASVSQIGPLVRKLCDYGTSRFPEHVRDVEKRIRSHAADLGKIANGLEALFTPREEPVG